MKIRQRLGKNKKRVLEWIEKKGYFIARNQGEVAALRMLKHALGLRSATVRKTHVLFIDGKQKTALNAFLR
ncbi:MAG: hypothetical protein QW478_10125, partial [Candidatus Micrarchaeaceae archaeon]